jgi:hypothetical protein
MYVTIYKDGSFEMNFTKEEAGLGAALINMIKPSDQQSAEYLGTAVRVLTYLAQTGILPKSPDMPDNVVPFNKKPH